MNSSLLGHIVVLLRCGQGMTEPGISEGVAGDWEGRTGRLLRRRIKPRQHFQHPRQLLHPSHPYSAS